ncbi:MAG: DNA polymerase III subunit gamma/tau [Planctomycetes bacterium]|nr:DNA polymerase III subunit gamma/tau [Planctomycetota bacterium]
MATLYREYRPQNFSEILGQNHVKITLQNEIMSNKIAHAYLFCGPRAVGKTTLARVFSKAINCQKRKDGDFEPCNDCLACNSINLSNNFDIVEIDAASNTGVDNVRENIISYARLAPSQAKYKVFIIDEVHMLSISAFNALLKIMEEPPAFVIFILCTTEIHKVPSTIISRCQRFDFKRINVVDMIKKLDYIAKKENIKISKNVLEAIARKADGYMRDAESLFGQIISISGKEVSEEEASLILPNTNSTEIVKLLNLLNKKDAVNALSLVNQLVDNGVNIRNFLADTIEVLRKMMIAKINPSLADSLGLNLSEQQEKEISFLIQELELSRIVVFLEAFIKANQESKNALIAQLPTEIMIVTLASGSELKNYSEKNDNSFRTIRDSIKNSDNIKPLNDINEYVKPAKTKNLKKDITPESSKEEEEGEITSINHESILEKWNEFLISIKKYNHSLSFVLQNCQPQNLEKNKLCIAFKYKFHRDRVNDSQIKPIIEKTLKEIYGSALKIEAVLDENLDLTRNNSSEDKVENNIKNTSTSTDSSPQGEENKTTTGGNEMITNLLKTFGGEVIQ